MIGRWIAEHAAGLSISAEPEHRGHDTFSNFDLGGVEIEVGELLYSLVRVMKPNRILETGTRYGISAAFMALALKENGRGMLTTIEVNAASSGRALELLTSIGALDHVELVIGRVADWGPAGTYDMMFLDTDLCFRFGEMVRFWPYLAPGGLLAIHDLHPHMEQYDGAKGPYGVLPEEVNWLILDHELQSLHLPTPRGFYLAQKAEPTFHSTQLLRGQI